MRIHYVSGMAKFTQVDVVHVRITRRAMPLSPPRVRSTPSLRMQYKSIDKENKDSNTQNTKVNAKNNLTTSTFNNSSCIHD